MKTATAFVEPSRGRAIAQPFTRPGVAMQELHSTPGPAGRPGRPKPRITRSRLAKPLLTALGSTSMLAASTFVILAVSSTGSVRPWDWLRADPALAAGRLQVCGHQGAGAIGCLLSGGFRPAAAAESGGHRS